MKQPLFSNSPVATPIHDAYLDNGTITGLTVGTTIISHFFDIVNTYEKKVVAMFTNVLEKIVQF